MDIYSFLYLFIIGLWGLIVYKSVKYIGKDAIKEIDDKEK